MSDLVLAIPKYDCPSRSLTVRRQRRSCQESDRPEREEAVLRSRKFTLNHQIKPPGNEVHQILTRKRSAKMALESAIVSSDRKRKHNDDEASVKFL